MRLLKSLILVAPIVALSMLNAPDASACGGCLIQQSESTQVTGHKMILSISPAQTTLWDQITYDGNPADFAWVLPVKGLSDLNGFELSSDALFQVLDESTRVVVNSPQIQCTPPPICNGSSGFSATGAGGATGGLPVDVVAEKVVGPFDTKLLKSNVPGTLAGWLFSNNYSIPPDIAPVITAYENEGFDFIALKLVPGQGINTMRPVRITMPGANPTLPLRMVAAGTGAVTPITLWILGEGRYEPTNMSSFTISENDIVWNWDSQSSNYADLRKAGFGASKGSSWLVEDAEPLSKWTIDSPIQYVAQYDPLNSGYADAMGMGAVDSATADLHALFGTINESSLWVTRINGELSRAALAADLNLGAASDQSTVYRILQAQQEIGSPPPCPTFPPCDNGTGTSGAGGNSADQVTGGGCAMTGSSGSSLALSALVVAAALALSRRRRRLS